MRRRSIFLLVISIKKLGSLISEFFGFIKFRSNLFKGSWGLGQSPKVFFPLIPYIYRICRNFRSSRNNRSSRLCAVSYTVWRKPAQRIPLLLAHNPILPLFPFILKLLSKQHNHVIYYCRNAPCKYRLSYYNQQRHTSRMQFPFYCRYCRNARRIKQCKHKERNSRFCRKYCR